MAHMNNLGRVRHFIRQPTRWSVNAIASVALVGVASGCFGTAKSSAVAPTFAPKNETTCQVVKSQSEPLIVEWPSAARAKLEAMVKLQKTIVVRYSGCQMDVLPGCSSPGSYKYTAITPKRDRVTVKDTDALYANLPMGAASLEAKLQKSGELNVNMTIVGRYHQDAAVARNELVGNDCAKATHVVSAVTVGAFSFYAGASAEVGASAGALGKGVGASSTSQNELLNSDGSAAACKDSDGGDELPPEGCGALIRLEVTPLDGKPAAGATCPDGSSWNGTECVNIEAALAATGATKLGIAGGIRSGYAIPAGQGLLGGSMSDDVQSSDIPVGVDIGIRIGRNFYAAAYGQTTASGKATCTGCTVSDTRFGVMLAYHLIPSTWWDPWVGFGVGYESNKRTLPVAGGARDRRDATVTTTMSGFELANLQLGANLHFHPNFAVGPILSASVGKFTSAGRSDGVAISKDSSGVHEWITFGVRGFFSLGL